ncbi:MAG: hypothetical protein ACO3UY_05645 [Opitutales bacterium]
MHPEVIRLDGERGRGHPPLLYIALALRSKGIFLPLIRDRVTRTECVAFHRPVRWWFRLHVEIEQDPIFGSNR